MRRLTMFVVLAAASAQALAARAEDANPYGARGRTILSTGAYAYRARVPDFDPFDHRLSWALGLHLTALHFVAHNLAVGGTLLGSLLHEPESARERTIGGDLDAVWHLPLASRFSLRLWGYAGVRGFWTTTQVAVNDPRSAIGGIEGDTATVETGKVAIVAGFAPQLLLHLSPSVALGLGPDISFAFPVSGPGTRDHDLRFNASTSYSFGPDSSQGGSRHEVSAHFSEQGRTALVAGLSVGDQFFVNAGFAYFVRAGVGIGAYATGGASRFLEQMGNLRSAGGGVQAIFDVPLLGSASLMLVPQAGYLWQAYKADGGAHARELQAALPVYFTLHLHDAIVIGLGPQVSAHKRLADTGPEPSGRAYRRAGLSSVLTGSF